MSEHWKPVLDHPRYEVSDHGRVRRIADGYILPIYPAGKGYLVSCLDRKNMYIHRLVVENFIGPIQPDHEVDHVDTDKTNNHVLNLEPVTHQVNQRRAMDKGLLKPPANHTKARGERQHCAKLSAMEVRLIRFMHSQGDSYSMLSRLFKVGSVQVGRLVRREQWRHVE